MLRRYRKWWSTLRSAIIRELRGEATESMTNTGVLQSTTAYPTSTSSTSMPTTTTTAAASVTSTPTATDAGDSGGISVAAKAGIGVGVPIAVLLIAGIFLLLLFFLRARRRPRERRASDQQVQNLQMYQKSKSYPNPQGYMIPPGPQGHFHPGYSGHIYENMTSLVSKFGSLQSPQLSVGLGGADTVKRKVVPYQKAHTYENNPRELGHGVQVSGESTDGWPAARMLPGELDATHDAGVIEGDERLLCLG